MNGTDSPRSKPMKLTILIENHASSPELEAEHGLSIWIEADGRRILFDTGQSDAFARNADRLGIDLATADAIVLSHGHYDHTGGLAQALSIAPHSPFYLHAEAVVPRYSRVAEPPHRAIGMPGESKIAVHDYMMRCRWTGEPTQLSERIWLTGPIPRFTEFEDVGGPFYLDAECRRPDPIADDQALWIKTDAGLVIVLGCGHAGVVNTIQYVLGQTGRQPIAALIGGLHLVNADDRRLEKTIHFLREHTPARLVPCHCTGEKATQALKKEFPDQFIPGHAGFTFQV